VEAVKAALKPYYAVGKITKNEYKDVMRSAVPKVNRISCPLVVATHIHRPLQWPLSR